MKYVRIIFRDKREITLPFERAEKLLDSPSQLIKLNDENGEWTGETINKSEIIFTVRNWELEESENLGTGMPQLPEDPDIVNIRKQLLEKYKPDFLKK